MDCDPLAQTVVYTREGRRPRVFNDDDRSASPSSPDKHAQQAPLDVSEAAARAADLRSSSGDINKRATVVYDRDAFRAMERELREMREAANRDIKDKDVSRRATVVYTDRETLRKMAEEERLQQEALEIDQLREQNARPRRELYDSQMHVRALSNESAGLRRQVAELNGIRSVHEDEIGSLNERLDQLNAKLAQQEFQRSLNQAANPASVLLNEFSRPLSSRELQIARPVDRSVVESLQWIDNPLEAAVRVFQVLLKDANYRDIHGFLDGIVSSLASMRSAAPELEQMFGSGGVDEVTSSWLLYEYSRHGKPTVSSSQPAPPVSEVPLELVPVAEKVVVHDWNMCAFDYTSEEQISLYMHMMDELGLLQSQNVPRNNMIRLLRALVKLYHTNNPYHNFTHAFDVSQVCFKLLHETNARDYLTELDMFCLMIAAVAHDVDHPGLNNVFQVNDHTTLAMIYNDQSPLENHHASRLFYMCAMPENNIFAGMTAACYMTARRIIIQAVLRTDMTHHFDLFNTASSQASLNAFGGRTAESRQLLVNLMLHMADISNPTRSWQLCKKWSDRVLDEFFAQGDLEKDRSMAVSVNMDRSTTDQAKMSLGFIDFIVAPAVALLAKLVPAAGVMLENVTANRAKWDELNKLPRSATPDLVVTSPEAASPQHVSLHTTQLPSRLESQRSGPRGGVPPLRMMTSASSSSSSVVAPLPSPASSAKPFSLRFSSEHVPDAGKVREPPSPTRWASPTKSPEESAVLVTAAELSPDRRRRSVSTPTGAATSVLAGIDPSSGPTPRPRSIAMGSIGQKRGLQPAKSAGASATLQIQMPGQILEKEPSIEIQGRSVSRPDSGWLQRRGAPPTPPSPLGTSPTPLLRQGSGASLPGIKPT
eukprot:TRINITY_DN937_c0_g1_i2.p1 TRINITY_DN937_c0_g1~~TRINITY_DN937_c0_g1_i2.p1  ORF type:complete len:881 (-),score=315.16 TRINITY_DN937_c0_g1_i2:150-2792(-)